MIALNTWEVKKMTKFEFLKINDKEALCRWEMIIEAERDFPTYQAVPVITKEEFLACFNEWVVKPSQENPVSSQSEFYIPVDNGGGTPV